MYTYLHVHVHVPLSCILLLCTWSDMDIGTSGGGRMEGGGGEVRDDEEMSASNMFQRNTSVIVSITSEEQHSVLYVHVYFNEMHIDFLSVPLHTYMYMYLHVYIHMYSTVCVCIYCCLKVHKLQAILMPANPFSK